MSSKLSSASKAAKEFQTAFQMLEWWIQACLGRTRTRPWMIRDLCMRPRRRFASKAVLYRFQMLAFVSVTLVREFTKNTVQPALFQLVPGGAFSQVSHEEHREMHGLTCAALAKRLDQQATKVNGGWKTFSFDVRHIEETNSNWLQNCKVRLGAMRM